MVSTAYCVEGKPASSIAILLTEKLDCDLECFRLDKRRCVVFWGAPVWNHSAALHLMYDKLRADLKAEMDVIFSATESIPYTFSKVNVASFPVNLTVKYHINGTDVVVMEIRLKNSSGTYDIVKDYTVG